MPHVRNSCRAKETRRYDREGKTEKRLRTRERIYINKEDEKKSALNTAFLAHKIFFCAKIMKILYQLFA